MAHKLPDELLELIIAPSLHVPYERFSSSQMTAFGGNSDVSSSIVLLVCKRWYRIAIALLYEVVVLRSTAQAQALADTLSGSRKAFLYIKQIRLEGAYTCLYDVFKSCVNLHTICFTLDIYATATVSGLSRSLLAINPTRVILLDRAQTRNAKVDQLFHSLLEAITRWTNLIEFDFPYYGAYPQYHRGAKPLQLATVLARSCALRLISAELPLKWDDVWETLEMNPNIVFKFRGCSSRTDPHAYLSVLKAVSDSEEFAHRVDFSSLVGPIVVRSKTTSKTMTTMEPSNIQSLGSSGPFSLPVGFSETMWTRVFAFATAPGDPGFFNVFDFTSDKSPLFIANRTRKSLALVSKGFYSTVQPFFFDVPLLLKERSLTRLILRWTKGGNVDFELMAVLPHLIQLKHFVGGPSPSISAEVFSLLAKTSGSTLISIHHLTISPTEKVAHTLFAEFRRLTHLHLTRSPEVVSGNLSALPQNLFPFLPLLTTAKFPMDAFVRRSLQVCGTRLRELEMTASGFAKHVDIFQRCPCLETFKWTGNWGRLSLLLLETEGHNKLTKIEVQINTSNIYKAFVEQLDQLFRPLTIALEANRFPALREVQMGCYHWPNEERDILKDPIVKNAVVMKTSYGVIVTDSGGQPWRVRIERRR
ncbi:hypothetical protein BU17DRAFT_78549 [Hysterangium stoloniferum]|nr:hypothetical protein BU17DRAFT_78549 [Hysterangium stoloniferum]